MKKKNLISIFVVLLSAVFALTCAFFAACGSDDKKQEDTGIEQTEPEADSGESDDGESSGGTSETPGESGGSGSGDGESSGGAAGDSGEAGGTHVHEYTVSDESWGESHATYTATLTCTKDGCTWTNNTYTVSTTAVSVAERQETCTMAGSVKYSTVAVKLDDGTEYTASLTERVNMVPHQLVTHTEFLDATCLEDGIKASWQCTVCLKIWEKANGDEEGVGDLTTDDDLVIPAYGHTYESVTPNENGLWHTGTCTRCHENLDEWHTYGTDDKCTATGCTAEFGNEWFIEFSDQGDHYIVNSVGGSRDNPITQDSKVVIPAVYRGLPVTGWTDYYSSIITNVYQIVVGPNITGLYQFVFYGSTNLTDATFYGLESIDASAFKNCTNLSNLDLGPAIASIGANAFENCTSLKELYLPSTVTSVGANVFGTESNTAGSDMTVYIEKSMEDIEKEDGWTSEDTGDACWDSYFTGTMYFYSEEAPETYTGTTTRGSSTYTYGFWHYNSDGEKEIWTQA